MVVLEAGFNAESLPEVFYHGSAFLSSHDVSQVFIPGRIGTGIAYTTLNWVCTSLSSLLQVVISVRKAYPTVPQVNLNGRTLRVNAGKALGGSTIINSMIFVR